MGYQAKFNKAFELQQKGQFFKATTIYQELIKKKPKLFDAQQMLALCYHEQGELKNSIYHFQQALSINPKHAATLNNLGNVLLDAGQLDNAKLQLDKAIKIDPAHAAAYNNLGNYFQKTRDFSPAIEAYEKAIAHNPSEARYHDNLGVVQFKVGNFEDALKSFQLSHNLNNQFTPVLIHMFDLLMMSQQIEDAANLATSCLQESMLSEAERMELHIGIAKIAWLYGDMELLRHHLSQSTKVHSLTNYPNANNLKVFHSYLNKLDAYRDEHLSLYNGTTDKSIVMLSESHGFAPSQTIVSSLDDRLNDAERESKSILSFMITGCKAWHLTQSDSNMYKESVQIVMSKLPAQCSVIMGFGEIDCRVDEGIFHYCQKVDKHFKDIIPKMVSSYINKMLQYAAPYNHNLIFYGVPAPLEERLSDLENKEAFIEMIRCFNETLKSNAATEHCNFLDVYNMTVNSNGTGSPNWYLDNIHLKPESFVHLFANHYIKNA